ncbi:MAG: NUDIX hydrolase [bacterium]|nr:NUDIX hydrolase [bacterium]
MTKTNKLPKKAKRVFKGEIYEVWQWPQKMFDGSVAAFEMLKRPDTAQVIPIVDDKILILSQAQPNRPKPFLSLAGGRREKGETPLNAAKRELLEETGYVSRDWKLWHSVNPVHKIVWTVYTYIARDCLYWQPPQSDAGEKISAKLIGFEEFLALADEPDFYESELANYLLRARCDKKEYKKLHQLMFNK